MNESKYPKSLSTLLALNLCALLTMLILSMDEIGDGTRFVSGMTGMQSIVLALGQQELLDLGKDDEPGGVGATFTGQNHAAAGL